MCPKRRGACESSTTLAKRVGKAVAAIHLFAVQHADALSRLPIREVLQQARLPKSYYAEVRKGINLAEYVQVTRSFP